MFKRTATMTITRPWLIAMLEHLAAAGDDDADGPLNTILFKFVTDANGIGMDSVIGGKTIAAIDAGSAVVWTVGVNLDEERCAIKFQAEKIAGADPVEEDITGIILTNTDGTQLIGGYMFDEAVPIRLAGDIISVDVTMPLPSLLVSGLTE